MTPDYPADCAQVADTQATYGPSLLRASPAFTHAPGCLSTVSAPLCGCKIGTLEARLRESARMEAGDSNVVCLAQARAEREEWKRLALK